MNNDEIQLTKEDLWRERTEMCEQLGLTVWEAENMVVNDEIPWGSILATRLRRTRFLLGEPDLARPWYYR